MKIEIGKDFPQYFKPSYPEEFELFSHFETTAGIPTVLFAITTWKENGKPNVCFHSWSCFHGDKTAFFAVMGNLYQHTHTYANIQRENCFCINFLPISCYDQLIDTICGDEVNIGKPNPEIFLKACKKLGATPEEAVVFEDSEAGIDAAYNGNIPVICVPDMLQPSQAHKDKAEVVLEDLSQAIDYIENM